VAIVSDKPQTTRNRILAVVNRPGGQIVLFDTPGIHKPMHRMNERMVDAAVKSVGQVDLVLWLADVTEEYGPGVRDDPGAGPAPQAPGDPYTTGVLIDSFKGERAAGEHPGRDPGGALCSCVSRRVVGSHAGSLSFPAQDPGQPAVSRLNRLP